ncbi:cytochrome c oxidase-assembly factor Cox23p, mitochondrial [Diutina catenulata]
MSGEPEPASAVDAKATPETPAKPIPDRIKNHKFDKLDDGEVELDKTKVSFTKDGEYKFYPDKPENHRHKYRWSSKEASKFYDPCEQSRQASMDCVLRNREDRLVCQEFFDAYRECKKDFFRKKKMDKRDGVKGWNFWR